MVQKYYFQLALPYQECLAYYHGQVKAVMVTSSTGQRVQFPASHIRPYMTRVGVYGSFCLYTENNKFLSLEKLDK
ncbi:DUF2835 domain-containing protein [Endozoicomonas sp. G2_1]|uniref:DUF2835 domain-containing protein n=1 Tax=Endozoicomonas sp. G2_1 TaxID=2821091 RepID=UPI001ADAE2C9|nr:DUF2835 domain-containing protein [Endozoicomonas sp. G2_1]MBO9491391.1 DUF2835 domain-containing protein [Endozoicomonas sp. G2_1]